MRTDAEVVESMRACFGQVVDPRVAGRTLFPLDEVLVMTFVAVRCGADDGEGVTAIADEHPAWFRRFLPLENGIPSHDTFGRVFSLIDPEDVTRRMIDWIKTFREHCGGEIVAIDGKALRRYGSVQFEAAQNVGWDQWRFAAPAHHQFSKFFHGGPAFEANLSHPTLKLGRAVPATVGQPEAGPQDPLHRGRWGDQERSDPGPDGRR